MDGRCWMFQRCRQILSLADKNDNSICNWSQAVVVFHKKKYFKSLDLNLYRSDSLNQTTTTLQAEERERKLEKCGQDVPNLNIKNKINWVTNNQWLSCQCQNGTHIRNVVFFYLFFIYLFGFLSGKLFGHPLNAASDLAVFRLFPPHSATKCLSKCFAAINKSSRFALSPSRSCLPSVGCRAPTSE